MATNPEDVFAQFRVKGGTQPEASPPATQAQPTDDVFAPFRVNSTPPANIPRETNTLGEEFRAGLGQGIDTFQGSLFGVAGLVGREMGINWLEEAGTKGAEEQFRQAGNATRQSGGFSDIDSAGGAFRWMAASLGEAIPSLGTAIGGGGIGGIAGRKAVENSVRRSIANRVERDLLQKGFTREEAFTSVKALMNSEQGEKMIRGVLANPRSAAVVNNARDLAFRRGSQAGAVAVSALPQIGAIDQELINAGITDPGLTAVLGGIAGGALEAVPALRLMEKVFPGVDTQVSKTFVKDFAIATGTQAALEGSTEAAQEIIQLASLAYHDPTFDMFSPEAKTRVVDAFAAGALVGAVTGGGAQGVQEASARFRQVEKPTLPEFDFGQPEDVLPDDFTPADNTIFEEVKGRVWGSVAPAVNNIVNGTRSKVQNVIDIVDGTLSGGATAETQKFSELVGAAHNRFVAEHQEMIDGAKRYMAEQTQRITETAATIADPELRAKFVEDQVQAVKSNLNGFVERLKQNAARAEKQTEAEVDNMDIDFIEDEGADLGEGGIVDEEGNVERNLPEPGEVESPAAMTFGKFQRQPTTQASGRQGVQGYDNFDQAQKGLETLLREFPEATEADFEIVDNEAGDGFVVETRNPELRETARINDKFRRAARPVARDEKRVVQLEAGGDRLGFKRPRVDIITMARQGRDFDPNAKTTEQGLSATLAAYLEQGLIDTPASEKILEHFQDNFGPKERKRDPRPLKQRIAEEFTPVTRFPTEGAAKAAMIDTVNRLRDAGRTVPKKMIDVVDNGDGTYGFGIVNKRVARALQAKGELQPVIDGINAARREEKVTGDTAGALREDPEEALAPTGGEGEAARAPQNITAQEPRSDAPEVDTKEVGTTKETLADHDRKILNRIRRPGSNKVLIGDFDSDGSIEKGIKDVTKWVQKNLGLSNDIIVMDDTGLKNLIESGAVSDPVFEQTLNDETVHARNIRLGGTSFVYLSPRVLQDPNTTILALGHELGHHLFSVAWDNLTPNAQGALRAASKTDTEAEFNEWMADQLAAYLTQGQKAKGAVGKFFETVGAKIRQLFDFLAGRERFQLNETYSNFVDAVVQRANTTGAPGFNPLHEMNMATWFQNEGVTMYKFFGPLPSKDNMDIPTPRTEDGRKALETIAKKYPAIAKRAVTLRNWVTNAYSLAVAPSTGVIRSIAKDVPAARKLVTLFNRQEHGKAKEGSNYHQTVNLAKGQFLEQRYLKIVEGMSDADKMKLVKALRKAEKTGRIDELTVKGVDMRELFDDLHKYATAAGLPVRKITNYFPRVLDREMLIKDKEKILTHLQKKNNISLGKAREIYNALVSPEATDGRATFDATETPGFKHMNSRRGGLDAFFDDYLDTNLDGIVANYVNAVVKRSEFNRHLGEAMPATELSAQEAIKKGVWDPKGKMHKLLKDARQQGATDEQITKLEQYIDANLGQLGRDAVSPGARKFMAGVVAYQNMRVLLFTVFASLPDMVGPAIRSGDMRNSFKVLRDNIRQIATNDSELSDMARAFGIISSTANDHIMTEYVDNHYMSPKLRKWNDAYFKWTGLNWYTDFTRKAALSVGVDYIHQAALDAEFHPDSKVRAQGKAKLAELGVTKDQVHAWITDGKPTFLSHNPRHEKVAEALVQFVDESIMRPNASQRPIMASHPAAMLVFHLKGYMYAVHDIILKRLAHNFNQANTPAQIASAIAPAVAMMLLTAVGLELREMIQYAGSNRKPPTDRMDGWEYTWELFERAGLTGVAQLGFDFEGAADRGQAHVAGVAGPALAQLGDVLSKPSTQTLPRAIPVLGQLPAGRDAVRSVL